MVDKILLEKYANLIVNTGAKVEKNQVVDLRCSIENAEFGHLIAEECYKAGAKFVSIDWLDDKQTVTDCKYADLETLQEIKPWKKSRVDWIVQNKAIRIYIDDKNPNVFKDIDSKKLAEANKNLRKYTIDMLDSIDGEYQWCIAGVPSKDWAKIVFPELDENDAIDELWKLIFQVCRINENDDPNVLWKKHNKNLKDRCKILNKMDFEYVEYKNSIGTDLKVYLAENHIWKGGQDETTKSNINYYPNIPTEEVFTTPHKYKIDGKLVSALPLSYNGVTIKNMEFIFKNGKVESFNASEGLETLKNMLEMDENSKRLGEIALVPFNNPIRKCGRLFYNTLFDENASCHFAFGNFYRDTIKNGENLKDEDFEKLGCNKSMIHVDFMVGNEDLSIIGTKKNGEKFVIFKDGNFAF